MEISSIKDWIIAINEAVPNVKAYETKLYDFYNSIGDRKEYTTSMMSGCYKKQKFATTIPKILFSKILVKLIISGIMGLIFLITLLVKSSTSFTDGISTYGVPAIIIGLVTFIAICGVQILFSNLGFKSKIKTLDKIEKSLIPLMCTIPVNYRNSDKMDAIAKIYFTKPTIEPQYILPAVDNYIERISNDRDFGLQAKFMSVMFDLPCSCPFLGVSDDQNTSAAQTIKVDENGNIEKRNQFLPSDIDSKVIAGSQDSDKDLKEMIGLDDVKSQIEHLKNRISFYGKESANTGNHMAFLGSAGTGKTSVARIVTKIMYDLGYIKKNQYIEISGDYLCAGNTSRASAIIEYSYGGVLFIDEAYLMYKNGSEVIGVLLKAMEDHRKDFICILAGYEEQMTKLFASNEGFTSRIKHTIFFSDYTEEEMLDIFNYFIKNYNNKSYKLDTSAIPMLMNAFKLEKKAKSFGNARTVRNAVDTIMDFYADRSISEKTDTRIITTADIEAYYNKRKKVLQHEIKNASAANQLDEQIIRLSELKPRVKLGSENPDADFNDLVGLDSFKTEIDVLKNEKEFYDKMTHQKILFVGDEGCGKSTMARILTGYLYKFGYIEENKYLDIPAELLKGSYVGHTAKRAEAIISYASGGVLYIRNYNTLASSEDAFAGEALNAINTALNENTNVTIIIGDSESEQIDVIRNMFTLVYDFPVYTSEQILEIFNSLVIKDNFTIEQAAKDKILEYINKNNSGIRDVQQIWANTVKKHISNFDGNEANKYYISENDVAFPMKKIKITLMKH